ncbi:MAG: CPBP family intramembrane glutamic endopeptidase [Candidatus Thermoplasmatota archaeon]
MENMLLENILKMEIAWILPIMVIVGYIFLMILLPKLKSSSSPEKEDEKRKEADWKKSAISEFVFYGVIITVFVLFSIFLTNDPHKYMGFPTSLKGAAFNFGIGGLIGLSLWTLYYNIPSIWKLEREKVKKICEPVPGPKKTQKYWLPISILLGAYWEEIMFRGALIAVPAALLTFPYDLWIIFILVTSFFVYHHIVTQGPQRWERKIDIIKGICISFALGLIFVWRWSIIAAGAFHFMTNLIPWAIYYTHE